MKKVELTKGQIALVNDNDFDRVNQYKWYSHYSRFTKSYYVMRGQWNPETYKIETILMHRFIMGLKKGDKREIDHINHDTLDNRKENLRITNKRGNSENRKDKSKYGVGIRFRKDNKTKPYQVQVKTNNKLKYIGCFSTIEEALLARKTFLDKEKKE